VDEELDIVGVDVVVLVEDVVVDLRDNLQLDVGEADLDPAQGGGSGVPTWMVRCGASCRCCALSIG
jgi:hypothetical protein